MWWGLRWAPTRPDAERRSARARRSRPIVVPGLQLPQWLLAARDSSMVRRCHVSRIADVGRLGSRPNRLVADLSGNASSGVVSASRRAGALAVRSSLSASVIGECHSACRFVSPYLRAYRHASAATLTSGQKRAVPCRSRCAIGALERREKVGRRLGSLGRMSSGPSLARPARGRRDVVARQRGSSAARDGVSLPSIPISSPTCGGGSELSECIAGRQRTRRRWLRGCGA